MGEIELVCVRELRKKLPGGKVRTYLLAWRLKCGCAAGRLEKRRGVGKSATTIEDGGERARSFAAGTEKCVAIELAGDVVWEGRGKREKGRRE